MKKETRIPLRQVVLLEGKYDKIKLETLIDAVIIRTDGFGIYRDREKQKLIRTLAKEHGAVIATDSDAAGFQIRSFLHSLLKDCELYDLYIPDVYGKEKRKAAPSKEGKLGVEGISLPLLREALDKSGVLSETPENGGITKADLFELGLSGGPESKERRKELLLLLDLPERMNTNTLLAVLNRRMDKNELARLIRPVKEK